MEAKEEFPEHLEALSKFAYIGPDGRDYGINVRVRYVLMYTRLVSNFGQSGSG